MFAKSAAKIVLYLLICNKRQRLLREIIKFAIYFTSAFMFFNSVFLTAILILSSLSLFADDWTHDILGDGYEMTRLHMKPDYSGNVTVSLVRKLCGNRSYKAVLYVHGYNDYFFQKELGNQFVGNGYDFYALDLRKYGRSYMQGQKLFETRDLSEYFEEVTVALDLITESGCEEIVLMGHSTGGLILSYFMAKGMDEGYPVKALLLNSPFLDMNLDYLTENYVLPVVAWLSIVNKDIKIDQGASDLYARSLLKEYDGEWDYDKSWRLVVSPDVTAGWLHAITLAQKFLHKGVAIKQPILLMRSEKSSAEYLKSDIVLNVDEISKYGKRLGTDVTEYVVKDGLHDLFLSSKPVRYPLYAAMFDWLRSKGL